MNLIKKIFFASSLFFLSTFPLSVLSNDFDALQEEFDVFSDDNDDVNMFLDNTNFEITKSIDASSVLDILVKDFKINDLLQEDFFLKTYPLNKRNILDYPWYLTDKDYRFKRAVFGFHLFYNQTKRMFFAKESSSIESYLGLTEQTLLQKLNELIDKIRPTFPSFDFDVVRGFGLFKDVTAQERRVGFLFHLLRDYRNVRCTCKLPLYYLERNFYMTDEEREAIAQEFGDSGGSEEEAMAFARRHLISDKFGFGDIRFALSYDAWKGSKQFSTRLGGFVTIPSSIAIVKGLYGSHFIKSKCRPKISLTELFDLSINPDTRPEAYDIAQRFLLGSLDGMSANLLETGLGNDKHFGVGMFLRTLTPLSMFIQRPWARKMMFKGRMSFEYLLPATHPRYYIETTDPQLFARSRFVDNDGNVIKEKAEENLAFLEEQLVEKFYPYVLDTRVHPGFVFWWSSKLAYDSKKWGFHLGNDTWIRAGERLGKICGQEDLVSRLQICKSTQLFAYQWKIFASLFFKVRRKKYKEWVISLNGDGTASSTSIGKDFSVSLNFECNF